MTTQLWRVHLITQGDDPRRFCIDGKIVGVGWAIDHDGVVDWPTYQNLASARYKPDGKALVTALNAFYHRMKIDDLCWTRDRDGLYYLGRILSEWRYENDQRHRAANVVNVRDADWVSLGTAEKVPGTVLRHLIKGPAVRKIPDNTTLAASQLLYNQLKKKKWYEPILVDPDLYQLLDPWDLENLVGIFLQAVQDYMIVPRTADKAAPKYEFVLIHNDSRRAVLQVKSGKVSVNIGDYVAVAEKLDELFLFTASGDYRGDHHPKIRCLKPEEVRAFAEANRQLMPGSVQVCIDLARTLKA